MRTYRTLGVSVAPELEAKARSRAAALHLSLSAYLQVLLHNDVAHAGPLTITPDLPLLVPVEVPPHERARAKR